MNDFLTINKNSFSPGEPIVINYNLTNTLNFFGGVPLGIQKNDGARSNPDIQFAPAVAGNQTRTFSFQQDSTLPPGPYVILGHERDQDQSFARFDVAIAAGWTTVGNGISTIIASGDDLFGLTSAGMLTRYEGDPNDWTAAGGPFRSVVGNDAGLYAISTDGTATLQYVSDSAPWTQIGGGMESLVAAGKSLYGINSGALFAYSGSGNAWTNIGPSNVSVAANDRYVFTIDAAGSVSMYVPAETGPGSWTSLGGPMATILATGNALYGTRADHSVWRYNAQTGSWDEVGQSMPQLYAGRNVLVGTGADGNVWQFSGTPGQWQQIAGPADKIVVGSDYYFGLLSGQVLLMDSAAQQTLELKRAPPVLLAATSTFVDNPEPYNWVFTFVTADQWLAGFDGAVRLMTKGTGGEADTTLPITSFERGATYSFPLYLLQNEIFTLELEGDRNFFMEHWKVDTVSAWSLGTRKQLTWNYNGNVPLRGESNQFKAPDSTAEHVASPTNSVVVYIWTFRGSNQAWGHASMSLSDNYHISWWPNHKNVVDMPFLPNVYESDAYQNQTLADDIAFEATRPGNHQYPDVSFPLTGLNEAAIKTWFDNFKPTGRWKTLTQNCSTTVYDALVAGGANSILTSRESENFAAVTVWTPNDVLRLVLALQAHSS